MGFNPTPIIKCIHCRKTIYQRVGGGHYWHVNNESTFCSMWNPFNWRRTTPYSPDELIMDLFGLLI